MKITYFAILIYHFYSHSLYANDCSEILLSTNQLVDEILSRRGNGVVARNIFEGSKDKVRLEVRGIPCEIKRVDLTETVVRHYTRNRATRDAIVASGLLIAGSMFYRHQEHEFYGVDYPDLKGVFFTDVAEQPKRIGVFGDHYIDFKLPPGTGALSLEKGVYLIPGEPHYLQVPVHIVRVSN